MKETHSSKFYTPELCLDMGTSVNKHAKEKDERRKMNGKELHAHIRSHTAMMEEKENFYDEAEKEGF